MSSRHLDFTRFLLNPVTVQGNSCLLFAVLAELNHAALSLLVKAAESAEDRLV